MITEIDVNILRERDYDNSLFSGPVKNKPNSKPTELFGSKTKRQGLHAVFHFGDCAKQSQFIRAECCVPRTP